MITLRALAFAGFTAATLATAVIPAVAPAQTQVAVASGRIVGEREIGNRIADLVQQRNGGQPVEVSFHGTGNELQGPVNGPAVLKVDSFSFDGRSGRFYAAVGLQGGVEVIRVSGRAHPVEAIPVLKNRINTGDTIGRNDIEWMRVPAGRYGAGYIDRLDDLVGQSPRRPLAAGFPIRAADIGKPEAIAKNGLVTMVAQGPGMTLTTTGRAMEAGSVGDVIQVMNVQSKKTVQATITGTNQVLVLTAAHLIAAK
jgi:flagella basal body P-ring formation protein FlgA